MTTPLIEKLNITSSVSIVIISISLMLFGGFAMTRITKRLRLPNVTAYIVAGILMGPYCLNLIPIGLIERMDCRHRLGVHCIQHGRVLPFFYTEKKRR